MQDVGSPASLKPPVPPLTRYKRDVAVKLQSEGPFRQHGSTRPASMLQPRCATQPLLVLLTMGRPHCNRTWGIQRQSQHTWNTHQNAAQLTVELLGCAPYAEAAYMSQDIPHNNA